MSPLAAMVTRSPPAGQLAVAVAVPVAISMVKTVRENDGSWTPAGRPSCSPAGAGSEIISAFPERTPVSSGEDPSRRPRPLLRKPRRPCEIWKRATFSVAVAWASACVRSCVAFTVLCGCGVGLAVAADHRPGLSFGAWLAATCAGRGWGGGRVCGRVCALAVSGWTAVAASTPAATAMVIAVRISGPRGLDDMLVSLSCAWDVGMSGLVP